MEIWQKEKIHNLVREKIESGEFDGSTYKNWFRWIKSLNFGHRPSKAETDEILFFGISLKKNPNDWRDGAKQISKICKKVEVLQ